MEFAIVRTQRANSQNSLRSNLAGLLADVGLRVLMIDAEIQTSLSKVSGKQEAMATTSKNQASTKLRKLHTHCLEKRVGDCNQALTEALSAICDAESEAPGDKTLRVVHATLDAAQKLTAVALGVSAILKANSR